MVKNKYSILKNGIKNNNDNFLLKIRHFKRKSGEWRKRFKLILSQLSPAQLNQVKNKYNIEGDEIIELIKEDNRNFYYYNDKFYNKKWILGRLKNINFNIINNKIVIIDDYKCIELIIDKDKIDAGYDFFTHKLELKKIKKQFPGRLYKQTVIFYNDLDEIINDTIDAGEYNDDRDLINQIYDFKTKEFISTVINKRFIDHIYFNMTSTDGRYLWLPKILVEDINPGFYTKIITCAYKEIIPEEQEIEQTFKDDNEGVCVYNNFINYFKQLSPNNKNAKAIYNKLIKEENKKIYAKPYTKDELINICNFCNTSLYIRDLVKGPDYDIKIIIDYARFKIEMVNTKYNHLDLLISNNEIIELNNQEEYNIKKQELKFYVEKMGTLYTNDNTYKIKDDNFKILFKKWKEEYNINNKFIYNNSLEFDLINTYDYTLHSFFNPFEIDNNLYNELDLKKAYFNFCNKEYNKYYLGLPNGNFINFKCDQNFNINTFKEITEAGLIGFFQIKIINYKSKDEHFKKLNLTINSIHTLTTPLILLLSEYINFKFINASYSTASNIKLDTIVDGISFLDKTEGIKHYCKLFGLLLREPADISIEIKPLNIDKEYYKIIKRDDYSLYKINDTINIKIKNNKDKVYHHMGYFIHSYIRCLILDQLLNMNIKDIFGVKLDSIVYKKNHKHFLYNENIFKIKGANIESMFNNNNPFNDLDIGIKDNHHEKFNILNSGYYNNYFNPSFMVIDYPYNFIQTNEIIKNRIIFIGGAGGSGKSYSLLNNDNITNKETICYTSCSWNLIQGQKEKYNNISGYSIPKLTGECQNKKVEQIKNNNIKFIVIDELTLINEKDIKKIIDIYKEAFIFLVGDIDKNGFSYQCTIPGLKLYKPNNNIQYIKYTKSFRFNKPLLNKLNKLRDYMKTIYNDKCNNKKIFLYVKDLFKSCFNKKENIIYNNDDVGITAKDDYKNNNNKLSKYFINKGTKPKYFIKNTNIKVNQLRGQEIKGTPTHNNYEMKLFKTIHSFQGLDLNDNNKIIISINNNFDFNLFYTALSRARREDQIIILEN